MLTDIKVIPDTITSDILLFHTAQLHQINLLFGSNGVGKSTFINGINSTNPDVAPEISVVRNNPTTKVYRWDTKKNYRNYDVDEVARSGDGYLLMSIMDSRANAKDLSEGQSVIYSIQDFKKGLESIPPQADDGTEYLILIDEIDSGLSVDNAEYIARWIRRIAKKRPDFQFIIAFNQYELIKATKTHEVLNMYTGKWITISSYDEYHDLLAGYRKSLLKIRHNNQFTGRTRKSIHKPLPSQKVIEDRERWKKLLEYKQGDEK